MSLLEKMLSKKLKVVTTEEFKIEMNMPKEYPPISARKTEEGGVRDRFMAAKAELPDEVTVIRPFNVDAFKGSNENTLYIAQDGCDCNNGTKESPLASVESEAETAPPTSGKSPAATYFAVRIAVLSTPAARTVCKESAAPSRVVPKPRSQRNKRFTLAASEESAAPSSPSVETKPSAKITETIGSTSSPKKTSTT